MDNGECIGTLVGHTDWVLAVETLVIGKLLASGSRDGTVRLWDLETSACVQTIREHKGYVYALKLIESSDAGGMGRFASGAGDGLIKS